MNAAVMSRGSNQQGSLAPASSPEPNAAAESGELHHSYPPRLAIMKRRTIKAS